MCYFTRKQELVLNILWVIVDAYNNSQNISDQLLKKVFLIPNFKLSEKVGKAINKKSEFKDFLAT